MENENNTSSVTTRNGHKIKINGYSHFKADQRKKAKQYAADDRQQDYDSLSLTEKIAKATNARGESKRQLAKLKKQAEALKETVKTAKAVLKTKKPVAAVPKN